MDLLKLFLASDLLLYHLLKDTSARTSDQFQVIVQIQLIKIQLVYKPQSLLEQKSVRALKETIQIYQQNSGWKFSSNWIFGRNFVFLYNQKV